MDPIALTLLVIAFIVAFAIGSNDETMSPAVGAHVFSVRTAVVIGAVINLIGAISLGGGVSEKVGSDLVTGNDLTTQMVFAILISMTVWLLIASATKGLPISTTQCIVGSVIGVAIAAPFISGSAWGAEAINMTVVFEIFIGWIISPLIGFFIAAVVFWGVRKLQARATGLSGRERQEQIAAYGLAAFLIFTGLSRGGNDVANAVAPLVNHPLFLDPWVIGPLSIPGFYLVLIVGGLGMGAGLIVVGRKVIKVLATEVVTLSPSSALSASIAVSLIMFIGTYFGLPLSGTHVLVAALIAVGYVSNTPVRMKQVKAIIISWVITVPISLIVAVPVFGIIQYLFPVLI
ncbi:MAG: anion permease [Candidatus Thorarchaeota archaeon]